MEMEMEKEEEPKASQEKSPHRDNQVGLSLKTKPTKEEVAQEEELAANFASSPSEKVRGSRRARISAAREGTGGEIRAKQLEP